MTKSATREIARLRHRYLFAVRRSRPVHVVEQGRAEQNHGEVTLLLWLVGWNQDDVAQIFVAVLCCGFDVAATYKDRNEPIVPLSQSAAFPPYLNNKHKPQTNRPQFQHTN